MNCGCQKNLKAAKLVIISGPSGSGKSTICARLLEDGNVVASVSATTRPPRPGEKNGEDYFFLDKAEFLRRVNAGEFAEHAEYNGNLYGTPKKQLEDLMMSGKVVLIEIDVQGARQLRGVYPGALFIFLDTPGDAVSRARLEKRGTETQEQMDRRIAAAAREREESMKYFDKRVINDKLDETVVQIKKLIAGMAG